MEYGELVFRFDNLAISHETEIIQTVLKKA